MMSDSKEGNGLFCRFTMLLRQISVVLLSVLDLTPKLKVQGGAKVSDEHSICSKTFHQIQEPFQMEGAL